MELISRNEINFHLIFLTSKKEITEIDAHTSNKLVMNPTDCDKHEFNLIFFRCRISGDFLHQLRMKSSARR